MFRLKKKLHVVLSVPFKIMSVPKTSSTEIFQKAAMVSTLKVGIFKL